MQALIYLISAWWLLAPPWLKVAIWAAGGIALAALATLPQSSSRGRWIAASVCLCLYVVVSGALYVGPEYLARRQQWLAQECRTTIAAQRNPTEKPVAVDGFLVAVDFEAMLNERFQRAGKIMASRIEGRGDHYVDLSRYEDHPVTRVMEAATFSPMAMELLAEKRFSYVEFEMTPQGGDEYSNSGRLNTYGWSGKRYRLYHLAPHGDANCISVLPEGPALKNVSTTVIGRPDRAPAAKRARPPTTSDASYCLALEINATSISRHRLTADEPEGFVWGMVQARRLWLPTVAGVRWDRIEVDEVGSGARVKRYTGFDYPDEVNPRYACNDRTALAAFIDTTFQPDLGRAFLRSKAWYAGSAVQAFYEPEKAQATAQKQAAQQPLGSSTDSCLATPPRKGDGRTLVNQLNDMSPMRSSSASPSPPTILLDACRPTDHPSGAQTPRDGSRTASVCSFTQ